MKISDIRLIAVYISIFFSMNGRRYWAIYQVERLCYFKTTIKGIISFSNISITTCSISEIHKVSDTSQHQKMNFFQVIWKKLFLCICQDSLSLTSTILKRNQINSEIHQCGNNFYYIHIFVDFWLWRTFYIDATPFYGWN